MAALKGAQRHSDYLIERARTLFPGRSPDAKQKAMNFLLPHIRRMPSALHRDEFAADAAQKLAIDSGILRQEIKQAAAQKLSSVRAPRPQLANETRTRAAARAGPAPSPTRRARPPPTHSPSSPEWYEGMHAAPLFDALAHAVVPSNPLDAAPDDGHPPHARGGARHDHRTGPAQQQPSARADARRAGAARARNPPKSATSNAASPPSPERFAKPNAATTRQRWTGSTKKRSASTAASTNSVNANAAETLLQGLGLVLSSPKGDCVCPFSAHLRGSAGHRPDKPVPARL